MAFQYKLNILNELKAKGYSTYRLRKEKLLAESTIQKMRTNKLLSWSELDTVCCLLNVQPGELILHTPDSITTETDNNELTESQIKADNSLSQFKTPAQEIHEGINLLKLQAVYDIFFKPFNEELYIEDIETSHSSPFIDIGSVPDTQEATERLRDYHNYIEEKDEYRVLKEKISDILVKHTK